MKPFLCIALAVILLVGTAPRAEAIVLGGKEVPADRFIVYLLIGNSNMVGVAKGSNVETYSTHLRAYNYKFDDATNAWILAQSPLHQDGHHHLGGGPGTPFLKSMVADYPGYYFGVIQNAQAGTSCANNYRRGYGYYEEIVNLALQHKADVTLGGVVCMLGNREGLSEAAALDFSNQVYQMVGELREDLGEPNLPILINRLSRGGAYWQIVQQQIEELPGLLTHFDIVPSDGPYNPGDDHHYTWEGQMLWGRAAATLIATNSWFPGDAELDTFHPLVSSAGAVDATSVVIGFDEAVDSQTAQNINHYHLNPTVGLLSATQQESDSVVLSMQALAPGLSYQLTISGVEDLSGNPVSEAVTVGFTPIDIPRDNLAMWLRSDRGVNRDHRNSVPIWEDQSQQNNDMKQEWFGARPHYYEAQLNGHGAVRLNALEDSIRDSLHQIPPYFSYVGDSNLFFVLRTNALGQPAGSTFFATDFTADSLDSFQIDVDGEDPGSLMFRTATAYRIAEQTTEPQLIRVRIAGSHLELSQNGTVVATHTIATSEAKKFSRAMFGRGRQHEDTFFKAELAEVLIYHGDLSADEIQRVEHYLVNKYNLAPAAGVIVSPVVGLVTSEIGSDDTFSVVLTSAPSAEVSLTVASSDIGEGVVAPELVRFDSSNWNQEQVITVTGVDDQMVDGDITFLLMLGVTTSQDPRYNGIDVDDVQVTNLDDDVVVNLPPTAVITGPVTTYVAQVEQYHGGASTDDGAIVEYTWDFGDGSAEQGLTVEHFWAEAGSYSVVLKATDDGGLHDHQSLEVTVLPIAEPEIVLQRPLGGEVWRGGSVEFIEWSTTALDDVRIDFSTDAGQTWQLVDYSDIHDSTWGHYPWQLPDIACTQCIVKVQGYYFEVPQTSGLFEIVPNPLRDAGSADAWVGVDSQKDRSQGGDEKPGDNSSGCSCSGQAVPTGLWPFLLLVTRRIFRKR